MRPSLVIAATLLAIATVAVVHNYSSAVQPHPDASDAAPVEADGTPVIVAARNPTEVSDQLREAFLAGSAARVEYRSEDGKSLDRDYWCRSLTEQETQRALRQINSAHASTDRGFELRGSDDVETEKLMTNQFRMRSMFEAARTLLQEGHAFITKGPIHALQSDDNWHYWSMSFYTRAEGDLWINVPIDLNRFPQVRDWRQREQEMNQFAETEAAYRWNSLDYTVRQQIVADGKAARERLAQIDEEAKVLNAVPRDERTADQIARSIALGKEMQACQKAVSRVPRRLDPDTLEWKF